MAEVLLAEALCDIETINTMLGTDETQSELVTKLINQATAAAETRTRRKLKSRIYESLLFDGTGTRSLLFPEYPLTKITAISIDGIEVTADCLLYSSGEIRLKSGLFTIGDQNIEISVEAGLDPIPSDLRGAIVETVGWNIKRLNGRGIGVRSETADGVNIGMEIEIPLNAARVFMDYARVL